MLQSTHIFGLNIQVELSTKSCKINLEHQLFNLLAPSLTSKIWCNDREDSKGPRRVVDCLFC